jgi:hypothetical protein
MSFLLDQVWWIVIAALVFWVMTRGRCGRMGFGHRRGRSREHAADRHHGGC